MRAAILCVIALSLIVAGARQPAKAQAPHQGGASVGAAATAFGRSGASADASPRGAFADLLKYVPATANVLVILDVARLLKSPYAVAKNWEKQSAFAFAEGSLLIPSEATCVVLAADFDLANQRARREVAAMQLAEYWDDAKLARAARGYLDPLGEIKAAWSPLDAYVVKLDLMRVGAHRPANRQQAARWAREARTQPLAAYLEESSAAWEQTPRSIMIAVNLDDALSVASIERRVERLQVVSDFKLEPRRLAYFLASLRGARLSVDFDAHAVAEFTVTFGENAKWLGHAAKPLIAEGLRLAGRASEDLAQWTPRVEQNAIHFSGEASPQLLRRVSSLLQLQPPLDAPLDNGETLPLAEATLRQFRLVQLYLNDLKVNKAEDLATVGGWAEGYAQRIDELPIDNVDAEFLAYRSDVSALLRKIAAAARYGETAVKLGHYDPQADAETIMSKTVRVRGSLAKRYGKQFNG